MTVWRTTIDELVRIFRDALRALVPHLEKARIDWRDGSAYDDWDEIAQTLYEKIVVSSLLWAVPEDKRELCQLPDYGMTYSSYAGKTVITVNAVSVEERLVFHSFATSNAAFDKVRARRVDGEGRILDDEFILVDADTATYSVETPEITLVEIAVDV